MWNRYNIFHNPLLPLHSPPTKTAGGTVSLDVLPKTVAFSYTMLSYKLTNPYIRRREKSVFICRLRRNVWYSWPLHLGLMKYESIPHFGEKCLDCKKRAYPKNSYTSYSNPNNSTSRQGVLLRFYTNNRNSCGGWVGSPFAGSLFCSGKQKTRRFAQWV